MISRADAFDLLPSIPSASFDTVVMCLWPNPTEEEIDALLEQSLRIARHNVIVETVGGREWFKICDKSTGVALDPIFWAKHQHTSPLNGGRKPLDRVEMIAVLRQTKSFYRDIVTYTDRVSYGQLGANKEGTRTLGNIWHGPNVHRKRSTKGMSDHPQPLWLLEQLIYCYTPDGGSVLEIGAGAGTGWKAATRLGMQYTGIEKDARMVSAAEEWMRSEPVSTVPRDQQAAYLSEQATRNTNLYCQNQTRIARTGSSVG